LVDPFAAGGSVIDFLQRHDVWGSGLNDPRNPLKIKRPVDAFPVVNIVA
jgi:hypothetical protein